MCKIKIILVQNKILSKKIVGKKMVKKICLDNFGQNILIKEDMGPVV